MDVSGNSTVYLTVENITGDETGGELMPSWAYNMSATILFLIGFFGFSLNLFVIVLMCKELQLWTPMNIILFNLVCSDFSVSILGNPFTLASAIAHQWLFGRYMCVAYGFFMALLGITSITTLTVLSYERFCLITYPLSSNQLTNRGAAVSVFFIWLYSFCLTSPPLFGWGAYVHEAANISCSVNWESQTVNATSYIVFLFIFGLLIPVIVISYSYVNIVMTMRRNASRLGRTNRAEKRVTYMIAIMIVAFLAAWSPYAAFALIEQFGSSDIITPAMAVLPALLAKSSICYNPLIYVGLNTQFRAAWKRQLKKESAVLETTANQLTSNTNASNIDCAPKLIKQTRNRFRFKAPFMLPKNGTKPLEKKDRRKEEASSNEYQPAGPSNFPANPNPPHTISTNNDDETNNNATCPSQPKPETASATVSGSAGTTNGCDVVSKTINNNRSSLNQSHCKRTNLRRSSVSDASHPSSRGSCAEHEMAVFSEGRNKLIRTQSYLSNIL